MSSKKPAFYSVEASRILQNKTALGNEIAILKEKFTALSVQYKKERTRVIKEKKQKVIDAKNEKIKAKALILLEPYNEKNVKDILHYIIQPYYAKYFIEKEVLSCLKVDTNFYLFITKLGEKTLKEMYTGVNKDEEISYTIVNNVISTFMTCILEVEG